MSLDNTAARAQAARVPDAETIEKRRLKVLGQSSPSQITEYETCPRRWAYARVWDEREPQSDAQKKGVEIDDHFVQPYLKTGVIPQGTWTGLVKELVPHLPKPGPRDDLLVQAPVRLESFEGGPIVIGFADWVEAVSDTIVHIGDLKTTSDFRYAKNEAQLRTNTQMITYAEWAYRELDAEEVSIAHVYGIRKPEKPRGMRVPSLQLAPHYRGFVVSRADIAEEWDKRVETLKQMQDIRDWRSPEDAPANTESCDLYPPGGCYYKRKCSARAANVGGIDMMSLAERLKAKTAAAVDTTSADPPVQMDAKPAGNGQVFQKEGADNGWLMRPATVAEQSVLPPDAPSRESTPERVEEVDTAAKEKSKRQKKGATLKCPACEERVPLAEYPEHHAAHQATGTAAPVPEAVKPVPPKEVHVQSRIHESPDPVAPVTGLAEALKKEIEENAPGRAPAKLPPKGLILYVDCVFAKGAPKGVVQLGDWLSPICDIVAATANVGDWRLVDRYKAPAVLAAAIRECLDQCPESLVVSSQDPRAGIALEVLEPYAAIVLRGVR